MKVAVTIQHPAHVHFFRHAIDDLRARGHEVRVFARTKDVALDLLDAFDLPATVLVDTPDSRLGLLGVQLAYEWRLLRAARRFEPDVIAAIGGVAASHVAPLVGAKSVVFIDNEGVASNYLTVPFADVVCTPSGFQREYRGDHRTYDGFHELAYLHPSRFDPREAPLRANSVDPDSWFAVVRFVAMRAHHDVGQAGFSPGAKRRLVDLLADRGQVYVTAEGDFPAGLDAEPLPVDPHEVHHLLAASNLYVGDSQTMATEAGLLGTPAVRSNSFAGESDMSNFHELAEYGLVRSTADEDEAIDTVAALLDRDDLAREWDHRRADLLREKCDVTDVVVETVLDVGGARAARGSRVDDRSPAATDGGQR